LFDEQLEEKSATNDSEESSNAVQFQSDNEVDDCAIHWFIKKAIKHNISFENA
jgi:hypothetical protein